MLKRTLPKGAGGGEVFFLARGNRLRGCAERSPIRRVKPYLIPPGTKVSLSRWDANEVSAFPGLTKENHLPVLEDLRLQLRKLHNQLIASRQHKVLVIIQAMDAGGKDGTVRNVFSGLDPQGVHVTPFKAPTPEELDHDFLWRVHARTPGRGDLAIWNRSHYEDIVAVRVRKLQPKEVWEKRFAHIVNFEQLLADEGTLIVKLFLHIDQAEQKKRLQERISNPAKHWKLDFSDLADRSLWDDYLAAYEDAMSQTSTPQAPWFVVPANRKWHRNLLVATIMRDALAGLKMEYPALKPGLEKIIL
jgi:PPK2 family polyphosphate:nucleotide phosphotransferase